MAVIAADELDDLLTLGEGAHEAQHRQACLRPGVDKADHLDGWDEVDHHLGQDILCGRGHGCWNVKVECGDVI